MPGRADNCTAITVKAILCSVISDLSHSLTNYILKINVRLCRDLTHNNHKPCCTYRFACNTAHRILLKDRIKDRIGDLIADLIRMSFCYRLRCK